jgi:hypothetical protein
MAQYAPGLTLVPIKRGHAVDSSPSVRPILEGMSRYDRPSHRVYMSFFFRTGWQIQFLEADLKTPLPRELTFSDPEKIRELAKRGEAWGDSESRQILGTCDRGRQRWGLSETDAGAVSGAEATVITRRRAF